GPHSSAPETASGGTRSSAEPPLPVIDSIGEVLVTSGRVLRSIGATGDVVDGTWFRNCNIVEFDGVSYVFSHRAILTVVVVSKCNAACRFCSNEITFTPSGPFLEWNERLARVHEFALLSGVTKIAFTGGEPTLNPQKLYELMSHMNRGFRR